MSKYFLIYITSLILFLSGCAVKQTDNDATKVAKHVVNSPLYAVMAVGAVGTAAGGSIGYGVSKATDAIVGEELYSGETMIGVFEQEILDSNVSYAKFFQNTNYALYKDEQNNTYLYIISKKTLIKSDDISYFKRWTMAALEKRPTLYFTGIRIPEGVDKEMALATVKKDRFGNPIAWGNNTFISIREQRTGWALSMKRTMILLDNGADTVDLADQNAPIEYSDQIRYYFPEQTKGIDDLSGLIINNPNQN